MESVSEGSGEKNQKRPRNKKEEMCDRRKKMPKEREESGMNIGIRNTGKGKVVPVLS
jgi:hypothetical protein